MNTPKRLLLAAMSATAIAISGCATSPSQSGTNALARQPAYMYAYQEREDPKDHVRHSIFLIGDGPTGFVRYTAAAFKDGARYSLASSGNGRFTITGAEITINAGGLNGTGTYIPGKAITINGMQFSFAMKMNL